MMKASEDVDAEIMSHHSSKLDLIWFTVDQWWRDMDCMVQKFANIEQNLFFFF